MQFLYDVWVFRYTLINSPPQWLLISPDLRAAAKDLESYRADYRFLQENRIHTIAQLETSIPEIQSQIGELEAERSKIDNIRRRARTPEEQQEAKDRKK